MYSRQSNLGPEQSIRTEKSYVYEKSPSSSCVTQFWLSESKRIFQYHGIVLDGKPFVRSPPGREEEVRVLLRGPEYREVTQH